MKPETFIILTPGFAPDEADSNCLPAHQSFVRLLKERYSSLNIIVLAFQYPFISSEYDWHHCRVIAFGGRGRSKLYRLLLWRRVWKKLKHLCKENNIIGLFSLWCSEAALVGSRFGKNHGILHYCWLLGQDAKKNNAYAGRIKPLAKELVAISDFIQEEFEKNYRIRPQHVIPIGIDPTEFPEGNMEREIDVLGAGSLIPLKQYDVFIEIISGLKQKLPGIKALICGKGPEENKLHQLIDTNGLRQHCTLAGELPHDQLLLQMKRSRVFLHTSNYEGFGIVCIEALFAGMPVISFCKPMNVVIKNWHIVQTKEEMIQKAVDILNAHAIEYDPVLLYTMEDTVEKIMQLYGK